jgi:tetratricopeptide (TPR) repeat protein
MNLSIARCGRARTRSATLDVCAVPLAAQAFSLRAALLKPAVVAVVTTMCLSACASAGRKPGASSAPGSLESYIRRVRALSAEAKPRPVPTVPTVESWDPRLSGALLALAISPTPDRHRHVALEYRRLNILDRAYAHIDEAIRLDPRDAAAFDARARIWRDWGFAYQGLADANRAVRLAPASAAAANTLGTLWQALGNGREARRWYERALMLDPAAAFAMNNLCYASITAKQGSAVDTCQRAVAMSPDSRDARNNLALAYAAAGSFARARQELEISTDAAAVQYNVGILYMADQQYAKASSAFDAAAKLKPRFERAEARARQARALAGPISEDGAAISNDNDNGGTH